jgi:hypothetical protein
MRKTSALLLGALLVLNIYCGMDTPGSASERAASNGGPVTMDSPQPRAVVTKETALTTAKADYVRRIGPLKGIDFEVSDEPDGWKVNLMAGGTGVYLIDKEAGTILALKLNQ